MRLLVCYLNKLQTAQCNDKNHPVNFKYVYMKTIKSLTMQDGGFTDFYLLKGSRESSFTIVTDPCAGRSGQDTVSYLRNVRTVSWAIPASASLCNGGLFSGCGVSGHKADNRTAIVIYMFVDFLSISRQIPTNFLKSGHDNCFSHHFQFIFH